MANTSDNIEVLYKALEKQGYTDIGKPDEFRQYVSDINNVKELHKALENAGFDDIGTLDEFSSWLSPKKPAAKAAEHVVTQPKQQIPTDNGQPYSEEVLRRYNSPDNKPGQFKDLAQIAGEVERERAPRQINTTGGAGYVPPLQFPIAPTAKPSGTVAETQQERDYSKPYDLSRPEEYQIPLPFKEKAEQSRQQAESPSLSKDWVRAQAEADASLLEQFDKPFGERMEAFKKAQAAEGARRTNRSAFDERNFEQFYGEHVAPSFGEERQKGEQQAQEEIESRKYSGGGLLGKLTDVIQNQVLTEKYTDPEKTASATLKQVQEDNGEGGFGDYVLSRMGINGQTADGEQGDSPELTDEEKNIMKILFAKETGEVADKIIQRIYDEYKKEDAPKNVLEYIGGRAFHDNFAATLYDAMIRRAAGSSGMRQQLRAMASEEYGQGLEGVGGWTARMAAGAAPFAVDMLTGGFYAPNIVGRMVGQAVMKGGTKLATKAVVNQMKKRAAARGLEDAALNEAVSGGAGVAERYLAQKAPIMNTIVRAASNAANFSTYESQSEMVRQIADGEFRPVDIAKAATKGAGIGLALGTTGAAISNATRNSGLLGKIAGDVAGVGAETGIFALSSGLEKAIAEGVDIEDIDWADTTGEALGTVVGMKTVGTAMHPKEFAKRYQKSKDFDLQLNKQDYDELKAQGINLDNIFKGLGEFGKLAPQEAKEINKAAEITVGPEGTGKKRETTSESAYVDKETLTSFMLNPEISSSVKRKVYYIATGKVLKPETFFGATMDVDDKGKATITTLNVYGNPIETKEYKSKEAAEKDYQELQKQSRANTIGGLERVAQEAGYPDVVENAKGRTKSETGVDVDNFDELSSLSEEQANAVLDAYTKNLQEAYLERFQEDLDKIESKATAEGTDADATGTVITGSGVDNAGGEAGADGTGGDNPSAPTAKRSDRREAAYNRGMAVAQDNSTLPAIGYDQRLAEARMMQQLPDSNPQLARLRNQIMQAVEGGDEAEIDQAIADAAPYLNAQQMQAVEAYADMGITQTGIFEAITEQTEAYEEQRRQELDAISDANGEITELELNDGTTVYLKSGDLTNKYGGVIVTDAYGVNKQVPVSQIKSVLGTRDTESVLDTEVEMYANQLQQEYDEMARGLLIADGQQVDIMLSGQPFRVTVNGTDAAGNPIVVMEDGSAMPMRQEDLQQAIEAADNMKIQQQLQQEAEAVVVQQRTERFGNGIKGYREGQPDLLHPENNPKVVAEYVLSQMQGDEKLRKQQVESLQAEKEQMAQFIETNRRQQEKYNQWLQGNEDIAEAEEIERVKAEVEKIDADIKDVEARQRQLSEIRLELMTPEERSKLETERRREVNKTRNGYVPSLESRNITTNEERIAVEDGKPNFGQTTVANANNYLLRHFEESTDADKFITEQRLALRNRQRDEIQPEINRRQDLLNAYISGRADLTTDEITQLTHEIADLEAMQDALSKEAVRLREIAQGIPALYERNKPAEKLTPEQQRASELAKAKSAQDKRRIAQKVYGNDQYALDIINNDEPQSIEEYISQNLGQGTMNWEGFDRGERHIKGVKEEVFGKGAASRGVGKGYSTNAFNNYLAPEGQGKGFDEIVHDLYEAQPDVEGEKMYSTEDLRNALISMLQTAEKPSDISHLIINNRIADAEDYIRDMEEREREAQIEAEDEAIRQLTGMEPDEYDAWMQILENDYAIQEGYRNSEEYFNAIEDYYDRRTKDETGGGQDTGVGQVSRNETEPLAAEAGAEAGTGEAEGNLTEQQVRDSFNKLSDKYHSAPIVVISNNMSERTQAETIFSKALVDGKDDDEIHQVIVNIRKDTENSIATYVPELEKIVIFADKVKPGKEAEAFFHENTHANLHKIYQDGIREVAELFWDLTPESFGRTTKEFVERKYKEDERKEEFFAYCLGRALADGDVESIINVFSNERNEEDQRRRSLAESSERRAEGASELHPSGREVVEQILKEIGYDTAEETRKRKETAERGGTGGVLSSERLEENQAGGGVTDEKLAELHEKYPDRSFIVHTPDPEAKTVLAKEVSGTWQARGVDAELIGQLTGKPVEKDANGVSYLDIPDDNSLQDILRTLVSNGHKVGVVDNIDEEAKKSSIQGLEDYSEEEIKKEEDAENFWNKQAFPVRLAAAKAETDVNPTDAQKEAGNYKMGHLKFGGYDYSIENPKGSVRSGKDKNGKPWSIEMKDTYGYILRKIGVDGDHLDMFINDDADLDDFNGRVYIIDQKNEDGTFDEHKVMYGYPTWSAARRAYERNYEPNWWNKHVMQMTGVKKDDFDKWLADSDHKTKPFADYWRTKNADTVSDPTDQLLADIRERAMAEVKQKEPEVKTSYKKGDLEKRSTADLEQLKKKRQKDLSTSRVLLATTNIEPGSEKETVLKNNIARAEADIAAIDNELDYREEETKNRIEQQEIGFAMVDRLESMGFDVSTDRQENRRVHKKAEQDNSEEGKLRHFETSDGKVYGFTYKGKIYLDPTKIDAELPVHEYAHPWCEAFRRINPEGWQEVVNLMKGDKDTWEFVKSLNPNLTDEGDIAEAMIAKFSGKRGAERAKAEYERMNGRDPEHNSKWGNIWQNISKAIQDFWKKIGDFLHIKYESVDQVYDQVVKDFANKINPRKILEQYLKERDKEYVKAVESGDEAKAKEIFDEALRENIGNGMTPYIAVEGYRKMRTLAHGVKNRDPKVIAKVADLMAPIIPKDAVLVPAPSHTGKATDMLDLAQAISERTGAPVADVLTGKERASQYEAKYAGKPLTASEMGITMTGKLPEGKLPVVIDNVVDTGNTAEACIRALGKGVVASLADSVENRKHVSSLKSAEPVVTDKDGNVVPLSERFDFMIEEGNLFSDEEFEEPAAKGLSLWGFDESTELGRKLADLKKKAGYHGLVGYYDKESDSYVIAGNDAEIARGIADLDDSRIITGEDGMKRLVIPNNEFDELSPKLVKEGWKIAFLNDTDEGPKNTKDEEPKEEKAETEQIPVTDTESLMNEVQRRKEVAEDRRVANETVKDYLDKMPQDTETGKVRQRATKALLTAIGKTGVPVKMVNKAEVKEMLKLFSMMNREAIKDFARRPDMRATSPHGDGRYIVYNTEDPFGVPLYAKNRSIAKWIKDSMQNERGTWEILEIGNPGRGAKSQKLRKAADVEPMTVTVKGEDGKETTYEFMAKLPELPIFYSNAAKAVEGIKQEKATPEQWLKMIEKAGGLKAGEDKWLGLSDWLKEQQEAGKKTLTKQEVEDFIRKNQIQIEDVNYSESAFDDFEDQVIKKKGLAFRDDFFDAFTFDEDGGYGHNFLTATINDQDKAIELYQKDTGNTVELDEDGYIKNYEDEQNITDWAVSLAGNGNPINDTRLSYTTEGLDNKKEIALTVPTIEPYNESDQIHFGDAGEGRAVAWVRFGDASIPVKEEVYKHADEFEEPWDNGRGSVVYWPKGMKNGKDYIVYGKTRNGDYRYGVFIGEAGIGTWETFDEAKENMNTYYQNHPKTQTTGHQKVLVIDEIQSKRHQDARESGYKEVLPPYTEDMLSVEKGKEGWEIGERLNNGVGNMKYYPSTMTREEAVSNYIATQDRVKPGVPQAPFEKNWHELAMKRMLRYAAENGYDKIAWTTGAQQAERYDLGGVIESINAYPHSDPMTGEIIPEQYDVFVKDKNGGYIHEQGIEGVLTKEQILQNFGKDLGARIIKEADEHPDGTAEISGNGLLVGAEGMKGFYDQMLPRFMDKYGKKWGVKTEKIDLPEIGQTMWAVDVTPEMNESVMQGQPMFQKERGGKILGWSDGQQIYLTPDGLNPNTPAHEYTHIWAKYVEKNNPDLWKQIVKTMKETSTWQQIRENTNYRGIWNDDNRMTSEVLSRLSGAKTEDEFVKAAAGNKKNAEGIISAVKNALKKFCETVLRLFGKQSKTLGDDMNSYEAIIRMPLKDLLEGFDPRMEDSEAETMMQKGDIIRKTLMGVHNISEEKLRKAIKQGGLANPSLAVIDTDKGIHTDYGDISLIPKASLLDSKTGRNAGTYAGDAYTSTYPYVERRATRQGEKNFERIAKEAAGGDEELERHLRHNLFDYAENNSSRLHLLYLIQKGLKPEIKLERVNHAKDEFDAITKIFGEPQSTMPSADLTDEQRDAVRDLMVDTYEKNLRAKLANPNNDKKVEEAIKARVEDYRKKITDENGRLWFAEGDTFVYENWKDEQRRQKNQADWYSTDNEASYRIAKEGLSEDYEKWKEEQLFGDGDFEERLFAGYDRDGNRKYLPNTVENASRLMNRNADTNSYDSHGLNATRSTLLKRMNTLSDIRKAKYLLQGKEVYDETQQEMSDELFDIIHQLSDMQRISDNSFSNIDYAETRLQETITKRDPIGYLNKEYGYDIDKNGKWAAQLMNFIEKAKELPAKYFETKFKRPVGLGEFAIAIVPEGTSEEVVKALQDAGLDVRKYDNTAGSEQSYENRRLAVMDAVGMRDDILFHIETDDDEIARLDKEPKETGYRNVVLNEDGTLGSPMANRLGKKGVGREATSMFEFGKWERSDENPQLADENGKINLIKPDGKPVEGVDYNPYIHIRPTLVNKQFKQAWERPNLVYIRTEYPKSELNVEYQAEKAAKPVGKHPWGGGELILSRWDKPMEIVPWEEVADDWVKEFEGTEGIHFDIIPPKLLPILAERGMTILPPHKGMGKACNDAYEEWKNSQGNPYDVMRAKGKGKRIYPSKGNLNDAVDLIRTGLKKQRGGQFEIAIPDAVNKKAEKILKHGVKKHYIDIGGLNHGYNNHGENGRKLQEDSIPLTKQDMELAPYILMDPDKVVPGSTNDGIGSVRYIKNLSNGVVVYIEAEGNLDGSELVSKNMWATMSPHAMTPSKVVDARSENAPKLTSGNVILSNDAAKIRKDAETAIENDKKMREEQQNRMKVAADETADQLGGVKVGYATGDEITDEKLKRENENGTLGLYDPNTGEVTLFLDNIEDVDEARRTVFHEKLGHEGLVALMGSQDEVDKFGEFVWDVAKEDVRQRIYDKANENDPTWSDYKRYSHAAQEVLADIAADGPRTKEEFSLWRKVKHYLIRLLKQLNIRIPGLMNDHDLRCYIVKTGEALKRWNGMSDTERQNLSAQEPYEVMRSRRGKPRKRNDESMAQYIQRLREWERWKIAEEEAAANNDPMPEAGAINEKWEQKYQQDLADWKEQNGIADETAPGEFPKREESETPQEYAVRVADYETKSDMWKNAPSLFDYMAAANEEFKQAYFDWRMRYGLAEQENVDLQMYEGETPTIVPTDRDMEAEARMDADFAEAIGVDVSSDGARQHAKMSIIERRKNIESANADDAIWIHDFVKRTNELAKTFGVNGKQLREALPDIIEGTYFEEVLRDENGNVIAVNDISDQMPIKRTPELEALLADIKQWYDDFFFRIEDAGLRNDAGYIEEGYVNHIWDREKSDPKAWEKYVENFQRTKSPNMRHREIETYREGREVGLVPKYTDIADIMAYYSSSNNQAIANKKMLDDLSFIVVQELNADGEVVLNLPLLDSNKPSAMVADYYAMYNVPGVGDVWVVKDIQRQFANVFGTMRTKDIPEWLTKTGKAYDLVASTAKKIELSFSAFHMGALTEVAMAQMRPDRAMRALAQYIIFDCATAGTIPAYAHPEDFKLAASHLVQLGATQDYAAADVNAVTEKLRNFVRDLANSEQVAKKAGGYAATPIAYALDMMNKGMDKVLWNYLHDGLKIACFKMFAQQVEQRVQKEGLSDEQREQLLDEAGQYVNDTFGGQYWELLNVSPSLLKWLRRAFLSPDWLISTQRHFLANFGFGSLYSESGFLNYLRYNRDNIKRAFGVDIPRNENRRFRSKNAKQCYLLGVCGFFYVMMNALNAIFRAQDEEKEKEKADEIRKENPDYKSPYELAYPDGMKWYDYTMYGNTLGQQTHLFLGRYNDGSEWYARWGKQFREFPELFMGRHGVEFPTPLMERMSGKANPIGRYLLYDLPLTVGMYGYNQPRETKEIADKYGNTIAVLAMTAKKFVPYSVPTQQDKEFKLFDLVMPSQKGFSRWKAVDFFKTYILAGDMDGVLRTYNAAVMNGVDAEDCLKAAISTVKATQRKDLQDGITDLTTAFERYDATDNLSEKKVLRQKLIQYLAESQYKVFTQEDAREQVENFLNGEQVAETDVNKYIQLTTATDVRDDYRLSAIKKQAKKYTDEVKTAEGERQKKLRDNYDAWFQIEKIIKDANKEMNKLKKRLGKEGSNDAEIMDDIRKIRSEAQKAIDKVDAPK